jgi:hypothetical protein
VRVNREFSASKVKLFAKRWVCPILFTIYTFSVFVPWRPSSWQPPCNNSWALVLHDAFIKRAAWGTDVVFTFGPYGFLYYGATPQTFFLTLIGWLLLGTGFSIAVWKALGMSTLPPWAKLIGALLLTACTAMVDVVDAQIFSFAAFAAAAWILAYPKDIPSNVLVGAALALASLVKFSWLIAIAPCVAAMTLFGIIRQRNSALIGAIYAITTVVLWLAAGQSISSVGAYLHNSLEITSGYAEAMQLGHPWGITNVCAFVFLALILVSLPLFHLFRKDPFSTSVFSGTMTFLLFVAFKAGVVRHDHHEVVSMAFLVAIAILLFYVIHQRALASVAVAWALVLFGLSLSLHENNRAFQPRMKQTVQLQGISDFFSLLSGKLNPAKHYANDMKPIAANLPFVLPEGTVDLYPWGGIDAMYANKLVVRHRPVFESYSAYTKTLAQMNQIFLKSTSAPDQLLFTVRSIDHRFPASDDGLSWPEIITRYDILNEQHGYLLMQHRKSPRGYRLTEIGEVCPQPGVPVTIPEAGAVWAQLDLPLQPSGKLLKLLYKPAVLILSVQFTDGGTHSFRLIPGAASAGFLISPVITNNASFAVFQRHPGDPRLSQILARNIAISGESGFADHYNFSKAKLRFFHLELENESMSANTTLDAKQ